MHKTPSFESGQELSARSLARLMVGLWLFALGVVMTLRADLGVAPWDVLHDGLRLRTPLTFGMAVIVVGVFLVAVSALLGLRPGLGTIANMILVGVVEDLMLNTGVGADLAPGHVPLRVLLLILGIATIGLGSALYIGAELGAGPRDGLMVLIARRTRLGILGARALVEGSALLAGIVLGGAAGVGTVLFALGIGPAVDVSFRIFGMDEEGRRGTAGRPAA
ncbi:MAG: hypothetical protein QOH26_1366 [Actinomycetota bacterium]|nr:hypothetical protein [Actinomycetota bacterium]